MKTISGELADFLFKGATIVSVRSDRVSQDNRLLVKMPKGILAEDNREIQYKQFFKDELENSYWCGTDYFCDLRSAKKLFEQDVKEDRLSQLRIKENQKKQLQ